MLLTFIFFTLLFVGLMMLGYLSNDEELLFVATMLTIGGVILTWGLIGNCAINSPISWVEYKQVLKPTPEYIILVDEDKLTKYTDAAIVLNVEDKEWIPVEMHGGNNLYGNPVDATVKINPELLK